MQYGNSSGFLVNFFGRSREFRVFECFSGPEKNVEFLQEAAPRLTKGAVVSNLRHLRHGEKPIEMAMGWLGCCFLGWKKHHQQLSGFNYLTTNLRSKLLVG